MVYFYTIFLIKFSNKVMLFSKYLKYDFCWYKKEKEKSFLYFNEKNWILSAYNLEEFFWGKRWGFRKEKSWGLFWGSQVVKWL